MKTEETNTPMEFDQLLSLALLERKELFNETNNLVMAQHMLMSEEVPALSNSTIVQKLTVDFRRNRFYLNWVIIAMMIGGFATLGIWKMNSTEPVSTSIDEVIPPVAPGEAQRSVINSGNSPAEKVKRPDDEMVLPVTSDSMMEEIDPPKSEIAPAFFNYGKTRLYIPELVVDIEADVPVLTEAQKKLNEKRKLQMFRDINKKKTFTIIPGGNAWRNGQRLTVNTFYLQCAEVSNWQYNVFLNDLILQGRTDDYLACKPVKGNWKAVGIPEFEDTYANDPGYEKFPVVNITRAAADMFADWWTDEMGKAIDNKEIKWNQSSKPYFRLPLDVEWLRAARGDHDSTMQFPWGYKVDALQNTKGCYLCNFNYGISKDVLTPIESDGKNCISEKKTTRSVVTTAGRAIDTLVLGPEYCYNPSDYGTYCMLGNVAEMVWTYDPTQPQAKGAARAMGGSWYSHADNVRIESKEQFVGVTEGSVNIGFRLVMVYR